MYNARVMKRKPEALTDHVSLPIKTVDANIRMFSERQRKNAALAREAQMRMGYPSVKDIVDGINKGRILNLPITKADLAVATRIWGRDLGSVVGKTTRKTPETVVIEHAEPMTDKRIILCIDLFFIGGLTFLLSVRSYVASRKITALKAAVESQVSAYKSRDYHVTYILIDNESAISAAIPGINEMGIVIYQTA